MPNLKHLPDDLDDIGVNPDKVRIQGQLYDNLVVDAEDASQEDDEDD